MMTGPKRAQEPGAAKPVGEGSSRRIVGCSHVRCAAGDCESVTAVAAIVIIPNGSAGLVVVHAVVAGEKGKRRP
ncbi:unnamed protein product [Linum trigynum]|uniref:Uncharacterized protein n=1 Tax=Linum trigynum TaxID=586398 RepID=A0AAV2D839_9ROSI